LCVCNFSGETWIVAGQSNATGRSTWADAPIPLPALDMMPLAFTSWGEISPARDPIAQSPNNDRRGPWPHFLAARIAMDRPTPYLVQTAEGSTCLVHALRDGEPGWRPPDGQWYVRMLALAAQAREAGFPPPVAVLWHQGECAGKQYDLTLDEIRTGYRDGVMDLADAIGADLGVPMVAALIVPRTERYVAVRAGILEAVERHPAIHLGPDVVHLEHEENNLHVRNVVALGDEWAAAVEAAGW
jgi:hypothetical protein